MCCSSTGWLFRASLCWSAGRAIVWRPCSAKLTRPMPWNRCWTPAGACDEKWIPLCSLCRYVDHPHRLSENHCGALFAPETRDRELAPDQGSEEDMKMKGGKK